ncbi:hypothetical protein HY250_00250 [Candidatus Azambacteria bacterium]|nr:hypothetical protein [Candidatus Azambacteria bacterium]
MDQKDSKTTCMACACPCEMHKEHNHPVEKKEAKVCTMCGHEHKADGSCDCGCK